MRVELTTAADRTFGLGYSVMPNLTSGFNNVATGDSALNSNTAGRHPFRVRESAG